MSYRPPARSSRTVGSVQEKRARLLTRLRDQMNGSSRFLFGLWLLLMILIPHILRLADRPTLLAALSLSIAVQVALVLSLLLPALKGQATLKVGLLVVVVAWTAEFIGHKSGLPFGRYTYTDALLPQFGQVPLQIPFAWLMMLPPAMAAGTALCKNSYDSDHFPSWMSRTATALTSGLAFTAWDLFLDPLMVAWDIWRWKSPGAYFGVPILNFFGWTLTAAMVLFFLLSFAHSRTLPVEALLLVYTTVWILNTVGLAFFFDQRGPAAAGFAGMGIFVAAAWRQVFASSR